MRKADGIKVSIGRLGHSPLTIEVPADATIDDALEQAGITLNGNEELFVGSERATNRDLLDEGDAINIVTPKEAGKTE